MSLYFCMEKKKNQKGGVEKMMTQEESYQYKRHAERAMMAYLGLPKEEEKKEEE